MKRIINPIALILCRSSFLIVLLTLYKIIAQNIEYFGSYRGGGAHKNRKTDWHTDLQRDLQAKCLVWVIAPYYNSVWNFSPKHWFFWKLERWTEIQTDRQIDLQTDRPTSGHFGTGHIPLLLSNFVWNSSRIQPMVKKLCRGTDRQTDWQTDRRTLQNVEDSCES